MEIQQHDGVVVEVAGSPQGFAKRKQGGRGVMGGREAPGLQVRLPFPPLTLYRGKGEGGGAALPLPPRKGCGQEGGGVHPPQGTSEVPSPLRTLPFFLYLGAWASWGWCPWPI